jgi:hypothetical protein
MSGAMSNSERQCRHSERVRNGQARATSKLWLEEAERVAAGRWVMTAANICIDCVFLIYPRRSHGYNHISNKKTWGDGSPYLDRENPLC